MTQPTATREKVKAAHDELVAKGRPPSLSAIHREVGGSKTTVQKLLAHLRETGDLEPAWTFVPSEVLKTVESIRKACDDFPDVIQEAMFKRLQEERVMALSELLDRPCPHCGRSLTRDES